MIKIQKKDFYIENEINKLRKNYSNVGAVSNFIGYVKKNNNKKKVNSIYLEVYDKMAKKKLEEIVKKAKKKWDIIDCIIIHRFGKLTTGEKIVMVATISKHRKDSFSSCKFIMSYLIVGATKGLGLDLAYEFAKNSKNLVLISRNKEDLEKIKNVPL